eukprot:8539910-Prorocentrum_lima.AAC.1
MTRCLDPTSGRTHQFMEITDPVLVSWMIAGRARCLSGAADVANFTICLSIGGLAAEADTGG